jgi:tRNA(Ile2)-agmatinylcytidine synthase
VPKTLLAFDDTDSPDGMCTTHLAALVVRELMSDYDLVGLPRLVRLNPNVPWKTRGNAAICLGFGGGTGESTLCGMVDGREVRCFESGTAVPPEALLERAAQVLERVARFDCEKTNPGLVSSVARPPPSLYLRTVREIVALDEVEAVLGGIGAVWKKYKEGRGLIGAAASMAWEPRDRTWEVIAYRHPDRIGTARDIDPESVIQMDKATKATFNNYDYENGHVAITPGSPCPILYGIRGDSAGELLTARQMIRGEEPDMWLLFLTNQATEDHIVDRSVGALRPRDSARIRVCVVSEPVTIPGKHVIVRVSDGDEIDAAFYEPSRSLRAVARELLPGDEVTLYGSVRESPRSLNVEKMHVTRLVDVRRKTHNPMCVACAKRMGSLGAGQGYRCKKCGAKAPQEAGESEPVSRAIGPGWYEPPVASRRHLHKPLRRMSRVNIDNL